MLHIKHIAIMLLTLNSMVMASCKQQAAIQPQSKIASVTPFNADTCFLYTRAIQDFIQASHQAKLIDADTLFLINRKNQSIDDFPNIQLPSTILQKTIVLIDTSTIALWKVNKPNNLILNAMGWIDSNRAEFIFVTFYKGLEHQYDYQVVYTLETGHQPLLEQSSWNYFAYKKESYEKQH